MMIIVVFPKFFTRPQKTLNHVSDAREIRRARFRAVLHEHAPFLPGWTTNDSGASCNADESRFQEANLPPYKQVSEAVKEAKGSHAEMETIEKAMVAGIEEDR